MTWAFGQLTQERFQRKIIAHKHLMVVQGDLGSSSVFESWFLNPARGHEMKINAEQSSSFRPQVERDPPVSPRRLMEILEEHYRWQDSGGEIGVQANFSDLNLESADLIDARLRDA